MIKIKKTKFYIFENEMNFDEKEIHSFPVFDSIEKLAEEILSADAIFSEEQFEMDCPYRDEFVHSDIPEFHIMKTYFETEGLKETDQKELYNLVMKG